MQGQGGGPPQAQGGQAKRPSSGTGSGCSSTDGRYATFGDPLDEGTITDHDEHGGVAAKRFRGRRDCEPSRRSPERGSGTSGAPSDLPAAVSAALLGQEDEGVVHSFTWNCQCDLCIWGLGPRSRLAGGPVALPQGGGTGAQSGRPRGKDANGGPVAEEAGSRRVVFEKVAAEKEEAEVAPKAVKDEADGETWYTLVAVGALDVGSEMVLEGKYVRLGEKALIETGDGIIVAVVKTKPDGGGTIIPTPSTRRESPPGVTATLKERLRAIMTSVRDWRRAVNESYEAEVVGGASWNPDDADTAAPRRRAYGGGHAAEAVAAGGVPAGKGRKGKGKGRGKGAEGTPTAAPE